MTNALVETTALTDYLLKKDGSEKAVAATLSKYTNQLVPHFSWKEFKRGPLNNFVWAHNKLADTKSFTESLAALQRLSRSPKRYLTATAIQALHSGFTNWFKDVSLEDLTTRYGKKADLDALHADALRLEIKKAIYTSWSRRRSLFGGPIHILTCYLDRDLSESKSRIDVSPRDCPRDVDCCLKPDLTKNRPLLAKVRETIDPTTKAENQRRAEVLRQLEKHPNTAMGPKECRNLGDAYFVLFCPPDTAIVTTNVADIEPMARQLNIKVDKP